jgi:hypothetical protein
VKPAGSLSVRVIGFKIFFIEVDWESGMLQRTVNMVAFFVDWLIR